MTNTPAKHFIEMRLRNISQLFNSMDPSPFHEKDLDGDAEEFITSWAMEYPHDEAVSLLIRLDQAAPADVEEVVTNAVHHFFEYKGQMKRRELRELLRRGRASLLIGLVFLAGCMFAGQLVESMKEQAFARILQESLLIGGWVAMWRPLEIFLYDWWPIRNTRRVYEKLSRMDVRVQANGQA